MEYIHIYEIVGESENLSFKPTGLKHTKAAITKKTRATYYFELGGVGTKIARNRLGRVVIKPDSDGMPQLYLKTPDNELARKIYTEYLDVLIEYYDDIANRFKEAKKVVENFKD